MYFLLQRRWWPFLFVMLLLGMIACSPSPTATATAEPPAERTPTSTTVQLPIKELESATQVRYSIQAGEQGLYLDSGGDVDLERVSVGNPLVEAWRTGNGQVISPGDNVADYYMQFRVEDDFMFAGEPSSRVRIEVEYLDEGTDIFLIQYDTLSRGPSSDGRFTNTGVVAKTNTGEFKTAVFSLCDAYFANRNNGGDFRIADGGDGAEAIRSVTVTRLAAAPGPVTHNVDDLGADPFDDEPDSDAIQAGIDQACDGDTVLFTSGGDDPAYQGYLVDKTLFLLRTSAKSDLTFSSTDPDDPALLRASADLLGFVVRLFARSGLGANAGHIDNITVSHLHLDGNRAERLCYGADGIDNSVDDNWGSWLPECDLRGDPWCSPGTLAMQGHVDDEDLDQDYRANPDRWTTGLVVRDVLITNTECGTALGFGGAAGVIDSVVIDTAGDHVHRGGCQPTDPDEALGAWADGITFYGPGHLITNNLVADASDIGIVFFGGKDTVISNNTILARPGNHGMFAGIAVHPYGPGEVSGVQVTGNQIQNDANTNCGGIHAGIDIGTHMWRAGCASEPGPLATGNSASTCTSMLPPLNGALCQPGRPCRSWGYVAPGASFTLADNMSTGAQINFLVEGLEVSGELVVSGNVSVEPRLTDWEGDQSCTWDGITDSWGALDYVAHDPVIAGWLDQRVYCER